MEMEPTLFLKGFFHKHSTISRNVCVHSRSLKCCNIQLAYGWRCNVAIQIQQNREEDVEQASKYKAQAKETTYKKKHLLLTMVDEEQKMLL